jgi:diguanylate cyclase (GGDEF)-like protein
MSEKVADTKNNKRTGPKDRRIKSLPWHPDDEHEPINHLRVGLSCIDYSAPRQLFEDLRASGVTDIAAHLQAHPDLFTPAYEKMQLVTANCRFLQMYDAADLAVLQQNFRNTIRIDKGVGQLRVALAFWQGQASSERTATRHTVSGKRICIRNKSTLMPGHEADWAQVLVSSEDITEQEEARIKLAESERYAQALFRLAPVSLWVEDYSQVKIILDALRGSGVTNLRAYVTANLGVLQRCADAVRIIDFNDQTLKLYAAPSKEALREAMPLVQGDAAFGVLLDKLCDFWDGRLRLTREVRNYDMAGKALDLIFHVSVLPGHEHDWSLVLIAKTDFTERKAIEQQLEHISRHDGLTGLYNRFYFNQMIDRIRLAGPFPASVIFADLNGLKPVNDRLGHDAGDALLCRAGAVLKEAAGQEGITVRMGGDEFLVLLPGLAMAAEAVVARINELVQAQKGMDGPLLTLSLGCASCEDGAGIDEMLREADQLMYQAKRAHYARVAA